VGVGREGAAEANVEPVVSVVINWNGWPDTLSCLESLVKQEYPAQQIVVVDNASTDDSVERIRGAFPEILVLVAERNRGFAAGSNLGIRYALKHGAEFVWLLNNDTVCPPDTVRKLVGAAADAQVGVVGTVLRYYAEPARIQAWGGGSATRSMGFVRHFESPAELRENSFVTFASVLLRREMLERIGLLDEGYFMYFEDSDLCFRARAAGWRLAVAPDTAVLHKEGASNGSSPACTGKSAKLDRIVTASGLRFLERYGQPRWIAKPLFVLSRVAKRALKGNFEGVRAVLRGVRDWQRDEPMAFQEER
jgi:GT2 family glycosyltransferase